MSRASSHPRHPSRTVVAGLVVCVTTGCNEAPAIRYETEHLRIGTSFEEPLCRGYVEHLERVAANAEMVLAADVDEPIEVYLWSDFDWEASVHCDPDALGCYTGNTVYSTLGSADHEIVHGVVGSFADPPAFWSEGTASAFQSNRTWFAESAPVSSLDLDGETLSYGAASAFARWLFETYGPELYRDLLRQPGSGREVLEATYGMSAEDLQEEYYRASPFSYGAMIACEHAPLTPIDPLNWSDMIRVDCDDENVWGGPYGMGAFRVLEITERGYYSISTSAPYLVIGRCQDEDLELPPVPGEPSQGELPHWTSTTPDFSLGFSTSQLPTQLDLAPGRYEVMISQEGYDAQTYSLSISASPGPVPQTPESIE